MFADNLSPAKTNKTTKGPLEGLKVLEIGNAIAGPLAAKILAEYGAEVVSIESFRHPNSLRLTFPYKDGVPGVNRSGYHAIINANKYGITLNLDNPHSAAVTRRLVAWCDVFVENLIPKALRKYGLDYESVRKVKPDLIMLSCTMQGQTGRRAGQRGLGLQAVGLAGFAHLTGWPDRQPAIPFGPYTDCIAPIFSVVAIMAALDYLRRTGKGQHIDISQYEASLHFLSPTVLDYAINKRVAFRNGNRSPCGAPHGVYPCKGEDRWCAIAVFSDDEWAALKKVMGEPDWAAEEKFATLRGRKSAEDELDRLVGEWTVNFESKDLMRMLQQARVRAGVVNDPRDLFQDPQLHHRAHFQKLQHAEMGWHHVDTAGFRLSATPNQLRTPAPTLGEHNFKVCTEVLGMSDEDFMELNDNGVFE